MFFKLDIILVEKVFVGWYDSLLLIILWLNWKVVVEKMFFIIVLNLVLYLVKYLDDFGFRLNLFMMLFLRMFCR